MGRLGKALVENKQWCLEGLLIVTAENAEQRISGIASASIGAAGRRALLHRPRGRPSRSDTVARFAVSSFSVYLGAGSASTLACLSDPSSRPASPSTPDLIHSSPSSPPPLPPFTFPRPPRVARSRATKYPAPRPTSCEPVFSLRGDPKEGWLVLADQNQSGPRELTGAVDLIKQYKLSALHDFFCKRTLPSSISDTHYLHNVVGETEIRKGEGMELGQLFQSAPYLRETTAQIQQFDLEILGQAFQLRDTAPIDLPSSEKGIPTISGKSNGDSKGKERKHRKHKDKDRERDKEHKKHKHRHKDRTKEKNKDKSGHHDSGGDNSAKHHEKKRKHDGNEDSVDNHKHKKSKHKSLKIEEVGGSKVAS
ncbi:hypothetical protein C4D60_Mb07t21670 [Musa balbisiana]|uniref:Mediator complex subunit 19 n=1 Tax=Musa balbisiana TaxID=52838 RepID=A0A4S8JH08_MUSBA|nr:hypothetical protein C4D60_Mb07t21670 [Musa balbisiana]